MYSSPCKKRKVKCDERHPRCLNCERQNEICDFNIQLKWGDEKGPHNSSSHKGKLQANAGAGGRPTNFSAGLITFGPSTPDQSSLNKDPIQPPSLDGQPMSFREMALPRLPSFRRSESPHGPTPPGYHPFLSPPPPKEPYMPLDPALTREPVAPIAPMAGDGNRYAEAYEDYRAVAQEMGLSLPTQAQAPAPPFSRIREADQEDAPSPNEIDIRSPSVGTFSNRSATFPNPDSPASTPPFFINSRDDVPDVHERPPKRMRVRYGHDIGTSYDTSMPPPNSGSFPPYHTDHPLPFFNTTSSASNPLTPASDNGDDSYRPYPARSSPHLSQDSLDLRRLSVNSLLSGPPGIPAPRSNPEVQDWSVQYQDTSDSTIWGVDRGFKDLDIRKNDDMNAISGHSPSASRNNLEYTPPENGYANPIEFGFGMETNSSAYASGSYYDKPVSIRIPNSYGQLPSKLRENPMNILYFHHFINHTAGCLVPHNCSSNPFKSILPQMALQDENLLNLLLAYSASHRARLLRQPEPELRIALWVQDIFPNLREALDDPNQIISNANLATAIMLASLEIISPKAFGVEVPWQNHLDTARQMIAARGGPQHVRTASRGDQVLSFLWSWFAYLDVLGSLSGGKANSSTLVSEFRF